MNIDLTIHPESTIQQLSHFIHEQVQNNGFSRAVIGLSGGVDSSLSCCLAVEALGSENVLGVRMPYETSSKESMDHAQLVIEAAGIPSITIPITEMVTPLFRTFPDAGPVRRGNAMARSRMIVLFDQSASFHGLVLGTGNKTEALLGYTTIFGDSACSLNPIGDLFKTQVRQLARAIGIPEVIITKAPSADLWAGQTDEGELGFTYHEVDQLLYLLVEQRCSIADCIQAGFDQGFILQVIDRVRRNHFKRSLPPVAFLTGGPEKFDFITTDAWGK